MKSRAFCIAFAWVFLLSTTTLFAQDAAGVKGKNQRGGLSRWITSVVDVSYERGICIRTIALGVLQHCILNWMDFECSIRSFLTLQKREETGWACMLPSRNILVKQKMTPQVSPRSQAFMGD